MGAKTINITGASQRVHQDGKGTWEACYVCHKCGDEFANSRSYLDTEKEARKESDIDFDKQQRRYCWRCGYKLTDLKPIPEDEHIAALNYQIDKLEEYEREHINKIKILCKRIEMLGTLDHMSDGERIAIAKDYIKMVTSDNKAMEALEILNEYT